MISQWHIDVAYLSVREVLLRYRGQKISKNYFYSDLFALPYETDEAYSLQYSVSFIVFVPYVF